MKNNDDIYKFDCLLSLGDSCFVLSHQLSKWCGIAPDIEEDIAISNVALDLLGHARLWYDYALRFNKKYLDEDHLAFEREANDYKNVLLVELNSLYTDSNFAHLHVRQFLFDAWYFMILKKLIDSHDEIMSGIADKISKENAYHVRRSTNSIIRLGLSNQTSQQYCQQALDELWDYTSALFLRNDINVDLGEFSSYWNSMMEEIKVNWLAYVKDVLSMANLQMPITVTTHQWIKNGVHTEYFINVIRDIQFLRKSYLGGTW